HSPDGGALRCAAISFLGERAFLLRQSLIVFLFPQTQLRKEADERRLDQGGHRLAGLVRQPAQLGAEDLRQPNHEGLAMSVARVLVVVFHAWHQGKQHAKAKPCVYLQMRTPLHYRAGAMTQISANTAVIQTLA